MRAAERMTPSRTSKLSMSPAGVELHDATEHEAVFIGAQAADVCRKLLGQHGDGAIGEIDAGAADAGFKVEGGAGADVLGHIGDVNLKLITTMGALADEHGVVEVARGLAVDGDDGQRAEVGPAGGGVLVEVRDAAGLGEDGLGKEARQLVLADHHLHVDAEVVGRAENFQDAADGRTRGRWPTGDLDIDDEAFDTGRASGCSAL